MCSRCKILKPANSNQLIGQQYDVQKHKLTIKNKNFKTTQALLYNSIGSTWNPWLKLSSLSQLAL